MTNVLPHSGIFEIIEYGKNPLECLEQNERGVIFLCVKEGRLRASGGDYERILSRGECLSVSLGRGYKLSRDGDGQCDAVYVIADGSLVYDLMRFYGISDFTSAVAPTALEALEEVQRRMDSSESDSIGDAAMAFHRFLFKFKRASRIGVHSSNGAFEIKNYIDSHLEGKLTLDELSKMFFVSKTQVFRIFKEAYGIAPMQYFLKKKVELAKKMLESGKMRISDIADALSFTDAKHFTKTFKRFTGELPKDCKKRAVKSAKCFEETEEDSI